jgi:hypothetical protein
VKQVRYGDSSFTLRFEIPNSWDRTNLTGVKLAVYSSSGTALLAAASATIYTATTTNATATAGDTTVTLAGAAGAVVVGDRLRIAASAAGPAEIFEVLSYVTATKVATLASPLLYDHTTGTAVVGMWATYAADFSSATNYPLGEVVQLCWQPQGSDDLEQRWLAQVSQGEYPLGDFEQVFAALHPSMYRLAERNFSEVLTASKRRLEWAMRGRGLRLDRITDESILQPCLESIVWLAIAEDSGDAGQYERSVALASWERDFGVLCSQPIWQDIDEDRVEDDEEVGDVDLAPFCRGF